MTSEPHDVLCQPSKDIIINIHIRPRIYNQIEEFICDCNQDMSYRVFEHWLEKGH